MIAYLDSSVLLRILLGQKDALAEWREIDTGIGSALVEVECLRTLDRLRPRGGIADEAIASRREAVSNFAAHARRDPPCHRGAMAGRARGRPGHGDPRRRAGSRLPIPRLSCTRLYPTPLIASVGCTLRARRAGTAH